MGAFRLFAGDCSQPLPEHPPQFGNVAIGRDIVNRQVKMKASISLAVKNGPFANCVGISDFVVHVRSFPCEISYQELRGANPIKNHLRDYILVFNIIRPVRTDAKLGKYLFRTRLLHRQAQDGQVHPHQDECRVWSYAKWLCSTQRTVYALQRFGSVPQNLVYPREIFLEKACGLLWSAPQRIADIPCKQLVNQ